ncbi:unnamed protein product [Larinioides sclopetarius]|uniref:Uncharacterized protein n=1 Tax=Larinioides sclopetarius TaxID=280406 RepID=A0AAV2BLU2_9ARAC
MTNSVAIGMFISTIELLDDFRVSESSSQKDLSSNMDLPGSDWFSHIGNQHFWVPFFNGLSDERTRLQNTKVFQKFQAPCETHVLSIFSRSKFHDAHEV